MKLMHSILDENALLKEELRNNTLLQNLKLITKNIKY